MTKIIALILFVFCLLSAASNDNTVVFTRTLDDQSLNALFESEKMVGDRWYPFFFEPEKQLQIYRDGVVPKKISENPKSALGLISFKVVVGKLQQISLKGWEQKCFDEAFHQQIKKFFHVQMEAKMIRKASLVGLLTKSASCK